MIQRNDSGDQATISREALERYYAQRTAERPARHTPRSVGFRKGGVWRRLVRDEAMFVGLATAIVIATLAGLAIGLTF